MNASEAPQGKRRAWSVYADPRVLKMLPLGFASGLPLLLTYTTLSAWLAKADIGLKEIGSFALVGIPYAFKFVWSPLIDRVPPPLPLGRRRGWGIAIQLCLIAAVLALGRCDPRGDLALMGALATLVAFLSASQDIVIDAYRVEILDADEQGAGAALALTGYRVAMLTAGAGALEIAGLWGWFAAYATMAALLAIGVLVFLLAPEPAVSAAAGKPGAGGFARWLRTAVVLPFADFMRRANWPLILLFIFGYKLGEAVAGRMATPLYVGLGFSLDEIARYSKLFGFFATIGGAMLGGVATARLGAVRALMVCGLLQSAGNLFYVLQAVGGHRLDYLALCVAAEQVTGAMAGTAMVAYLSSLCSPAFTATQYALLSSVSALGLYLVGSQSGRLAEALGWVPFFLTTTVATLPALLLLAWLSHRGTGVTRPPPAGRP